MIDMTKMITLEEDAYQLLAQHKQGEESFSEEIKRICLEQSKKRKLVELFGILSKEEGNAMQKSLKQIKKMNLKLLKKRLKRRDFV